MGKTKMKRLRYGYGVDGMGAPAIEPYLSTRRSFGVVCDDRDEASVLRRA